MLLHSSSASLTAGQWSVAVSGCVEWSSFWVCIYGQVSEKVVIENIECVQSKSPRPKAALARSHKVGLRFTPATREAGENRGYRWPNVRAAVPTLARTRPCRATVKHDTTVLACLPCRA
jgi:hypothetical protein